MMARGSAWPLAAAMVLAWLPLAPRAMTLAEAFEAARAHDPQYRAAEYQREAAREAVPLARAGLLPQISLSHSNTRTEGSRESPSVLPQQQTVTRVEYTSPQTTLSLRMPLYSKEAWIRLDQAGAQAKGAGAFLLAQELNLVDRVLTAYLQVLEAQSLQTLVEAELMALADQLRRAESRLRRGEGTRTEEAQAQAALEVARARHADASGRVGVGLARLKRFTGREAAFVRDTSPEFRPQRAAASAVQDWTARARANHPMVQLREAAVEVARHGLRRNKAGHLPRLDLVGNVVSARNDSVNNLDQSARLRSLGVQLSVPLYSGGGVDAGVRQAGAELARAEQELRNEVESNALEIRVSVHAADSAALRIDAMGRAVAASEVALTGSTRGQQAGQATQTDVLDARSRLFAARRDLAQAQYDHLTARARTLMLTGESAPRVVEQIDALLSSRVELKAP